MRRFLLDDAVVTREWVASEIERSRRLFDANGYGTWAVTLVGRDEVIGFCGFRFFFEVHELQLFYGFDPAHWVEDS